MLYLAMILMLQGSPDRAECEENGGYFKNAGQSCLDDGDMDAAQTLLFKALRLAERQLVGSLRNQADFTPAAAAVRKAEFDALIAALEAKRDATDGAPAQVYQDQIDHLTERRDRLDSTEEFDPDVPGSKDSERTKAGKLGPVISQLQLDIINLKRDLNDSF